MNQGIASHTTLWYHSLWHVYSAFSSRLVREVPEINLEMVHEGARGSIILSNISRDLIPKLHSFGPQGAFNHLPHGVGELDLLFACIVSLVLFWWSTADCVALDPIDLYAHFRLTA